MAKDDVIDDRSGPPHSGVTGYVERLVQSGAAIVLSINGERELRLTNQFARERFVEMLDRLEYIESVHEALEAMNRGEPAIPFDEFIERFRREHDLPECS